MAPWYLYGFAVLAAGLLWVFLYALFELSHRCDER